MNLNGFDVEESKILRLSGKPQNAPEGMIQDLCELNQWGGDQVGEQQRRTCVWSQEKSTGF